MTPLKFRAWHKAKQKMVLFSGGWTIQSDEHEGLTFGPDDFGHGIDAGSQDDDVVLMQSTGLTDKNGVEIYEGDIVRGKHFDETFVSPVVWGGGNEHQAGFYFNVEGYYWETDGLYSPWDGLEVIGNIYQNPDLLPR